MGITLRAKRLLEGSEDVRTEMMLKIKPPIDQDLMFPVAKNLHLIDPATGEDIGLWLLRKAAIEQVFEPILSYAQSIKSTTLLKSLLIASQPPKSFEIISFIFNNHLTDEFSNQINRPLMSVEAQDFAISEWDPTDHARSRVLLFASGYYRNQGKDFNLDLYQKFFEILYTQPSMENAESAIDKIFSVDKNYAEGLQKRNWPKEIVENQSWSSLLLTFSALVHAKQIKNRALVFDWMNHFFNRLADQNISIKDQAIVPLELNAFILLSNSIKEFILDDNSIGERQIACQLLQTFSTLFRTPKKVLSEFVDLNEQVQTDKVKIYIEKSIHQLESMKTHPQETNI